jgi:S1-C subfamily serine protease
MVTLSPELREELNRDKELNLNITAERGVLVIRVVPNSPAAKAGFRAGDIIERVSGQKVATAADVQDQVEKSQIGTKLRVEVNRDGDTTTFIVEPGAFPAESEN